MAFDITNLSRLIPFTTYLGQADALLQDQLAGLTTNPLDNVNLATTMELFTAGVGFTYNPSTGVINSIGTTSVNIDSVVLGSSSVGLRVLVKNQSAATQNGIYDITTAGSGVTTVLTRSQDFNQNSEIIQYSKVVVSNPTASGSLNENKIFFLDIATSTGTLNTTNLVWSEYPTASSTQSLLKEVRTGFDNTDNRSDSEYTNIQSLINQARAVELNISTTLNNIVVPICTSLNSFYTAQYGSRFRTYFKDVYVSDPTSSIWTEDFRRLWRRALAEELVIRLGSIAKSGASWGSFTADKTISLDSSLELRTLASIGSTAIPVAVYLTKSAGTSELITLTIPAGTGVTSFDLTSTTTTKFNGVESVTISNSYGVDGTTFEFWVKP
jgi:hypothetical protein